MILTLIAKKRQSKDGTQQWWAFSHVKGGKWYDVRFLNDVGLPKIYDIDKPNKVYRAFIQISPQSIDITQKNERNIIYVKDYAVPDNDNPLFIGMVNNERERIKTYRDQRDAIKRDFFATTTENEYLEESAAETSTENKNNDDLPF